MISDHVRILRTCKILLGVQKAARGKYNRKREGADARYYPLYRAVACRMTDILSDTQCPGAGVQSVLRMYVTPVDYLGTDYT